MRRWGVGAVGLCVLALAAPACGDAAASDAGPSLDAAGDPASGEAALDQGAGTEPGTEAGVTTGAVTAAAPPVVVWPPTSTTADPAELADLRASAVGSTTTTSTTSTTEDAGATDAPALRTPTADDPLRVLVVGDSVGFDASPGIEAALEATGAVAVELRAAPGVGLTTGPEIADWRAHWVADVAEVRPELVVLMTGSLDVYAMRTSATAPEAYRSLTDDALDILGAGGARVLVIGVLPHDVVGATYEEAVADRSTRPVVNAVLRAAALDRADLADFLLLDEQFSDDLGRFEFYVTGPDGGLVRARKADGLHICPDGAAIVGEAVAGAVDRWWALPAVDVAYRSGPWRLDPRYDYPAHSCDVDPAVISGAAAPPPPWSAAAERSGHP